MKEIILLATMLNFVPTFAQQKATTVKVDQKQTHIQMHEQMAKAHQQAAECLKSGKPEEECRNAFREMCSEYGGHGMCGAGMMNYKANKKGK